MAQHFFLRSLGSVSEAVYFSFVVALIVGVFSIYLLNDYVRKKTRQYADKIIRGEIPFKNIEESKISEIINKLNTYIQAELGKGTFESKEIIERYKKEDLERISQLEEILKKIK